MKRVAIYRERLLPVSETFIRDQVSSLTSWQPVLLGLSEVEGGLATPDVIREIVPSTPAHIVNWLRIRLHRPVPALVERLRQLDVQLVHAHFGTDATDIWPSARLAGLPLLVTLHGFDIFRHRKWWETARAGLRRRSYPGRLLRMAQDPSVHFVAVSHAVRQRAVEYGIPEGKVTVAYVGVDVRRFTPGKVPIERRPRRILFTGRMVENKAPLLMVSAFAKLRKDRTDAELVMIGTGPLLLKAKRLAEELGVPVDFPGNLSSDDIVAQLHQARVFCLPSITAASGDSEGFGLVLLEAQACGVPVVTSARGGGQEGMIDRKTGFRFPEGDQQALVDCLRSILDDPDVNSSMSSEAIKFARQRFDITACTRKLEDVYLRHTQ